MNKALIRALQYLCLTGLFVVLVAANSHTFRSVRWDLTADQIYTLSPGSVDIVTGLDAPIDVYFFFSKSTSEGLSTLRDYAARVLSLLKEYESISDGNLRVHVIDPEPFSEAEDQANEYGLTAAVMPSTQDAIYFGVVAKNGQDKQEIIGFFDPQKEPFLEYQLSELWYQLSEPEQVKIGVMSGLNVTGGQNPMTGQFDPPWYVYSQLESLYDMVQLPVELPKIPQEVKVLLLIHPQQLSEQTQFAIDQFVLGGGKLIAFIDPHHESDPMAVMTGTGVPNQSDLSQLFSAWGMQVHSDKVVLDVANGLEIRTQQGVTKHLGFIGLNKEALDDSDVITSSLDAINGASFGYVELTPDSELEVIPLMVSSEFSNLIPNGEYASSLSPEPLFSHVIEPQSEYILAGRFSGEAKSAFSDFPQEYSEEAQNQPRLTSGNIQVVVVADTDLLTDRFWVSQANFFGETIHSAFADNGVLVVNAVDNMAGSNALISIRSRGTFARPFTRVDALTAQAELRFLEQEQLLEQELLEIENALSELQSQQHATDTLVLTPEQENALAEFNDKRIEVRKALREVRHQLDKDIAKLGSQLKFLNIALMPLLLVGLLAWLMRALRLRAH